MSPRLEALCLEADVQSYYTCSNQYILKAPEKALRSTDDHTKRVALAADVPQRLENRCSFCRKVNDLSTLLPAEHEHCQTISHCPIPPWQLSTPCKEQISTSVPGIAGQTDGNDLKCRCIITFIVLY